MLYFQTKPDDAFQSIVRVSLGMHIDELRCEYTPDTEAMWDYIDILKRCFDRKGLLHSAEQLLEAHESEKLYGMTDYHYLILYDFLDLSTTYHNDYLGDKNGTGLFTDPMIGPIDFSSLVGWFFWDTDFLVDPTGYDGLSPDAKNWIGLSQEIFGIVHGLKPHPDEMVLKEMKMPANWSGSDFPYPPGEEFPYYPQEELDKL